MDRLAYLAQQHWQKYLPAAYASIEDKQAFFQTLSDEAQAQIEDLEESLRGPDQADETYADRMSRYRVARQMAESAVMREEWFLPPAEDDNLTRESTGDDEMQQAYQTFQNLREQLRE